MATTTTLANDIQVIVSSDVVTGFFRNDEFFSMFTQLKSGTDTSYRWHVLTAGLTGTLKAEGDAFSAAQATTNSRATLGYHLHDSTIRVTDHLRAALGPRNEGSYWQSLAVEVIQARKAVQQAIMTRWLGATAGTDGLQLAIDSTGTYAGLDHAAITGWDSVETAVGGLLSYAALDDQRETLRDNPRRSASNLCLFPENQVTNFTRLSGPGIRNTFVLNAAEGSNNFNIGAADTGLKFGNCDIKGVAELTDTVILCMKKEDATIRYRERQTGDFGWASEEIPRGGFQTDVNVSWFGHLCLRDPFRAAKLTGVTA